MSFESLDRTLLLAIAGGLIMAALGRIPTITDVLLLPEADRPAHAEFESGITGRWIARITVMEDRRVDKVILTPVTDEEAKEYL